MHKKRSLIVVTAVILIFAVCIGPAAAYANYEYIWTASGNQFVRDDDITSGFALNAIHFGPYYRYDNLESTDTILVTPFVNAINKNGVHPKVRYLWFALYMPVGVNANYIRVYNGPTSVYSHSINWQGTGAYKEYMLDMGSYKDMNRGINVELTIHNPVTSTKTVYTFGAGAKEEW